MKKKFVRLISAVLSAVMTLTAVPLSAFAEGETHTHDGESNVITTPLDFREKKADENGVGWSWDHDTKTLTLDGVNIQATTGSMSVVTVPDGTEIVLKGENTIVQTDTGESYTYVLSAVNTNDINCDGTMTISGDGVLNAENRSTDSMARSLGGTIILNGGTVNATGKVVAKSLEIHNDGVLNANASATSYDGAAVNVGGSITVDGNGSLNAVGCAIENQDIMNTAILLNGNQDSKISVTGNGSITVPDSNGARYGICYDVDRRRINAEISGKVTAYGTMCGISGINLIMSGTGSVYATGDTLGIDNTDPSIDEDEFVIKGSTEYKASESTVTGEVTLYGVYYKIGEAYAKTVVIKPDTSPRIILGKQTGIFKTEEYEIIEDMTDIKLKGTVYFDITLKNMSDEEFADARGYFGGDEPDLSASIIKTDYGWVCMVCDTEFSTTYDTDNTLTIKCGDIVSNTVQVKSNANRFNKVTQGDNTNRTVFYTNTSQEEKDNYKLVSTYTVDSESISYNWYSTNSAYSADELGAAVSGSNGEFKLADNIPAGNYVLYCDITYSDGDSTETVTEKFTFTYKECAHENGYSDGKCTNCGALCDHSDINAEDGVCRICGEIASVAIYTDANGISKYVDTDELHSLLNEYGKSGTVKLFKDYYKLEQHDIDGVITIDLNGHDFTVRGVTPWSGGKVTFKNSGSEQVTCSGSVSPTVDAPGGTLIVDGDIYFDSAININDYGTVILNAGKYVDLTIKGDRTLYDMLGEGKAFFDANGNLFNASVQAGSDLTVKAHSHTYVDGKCDCGYVCPHSNVDSETGKCTECEYQYAAVIVKDGAVAFVYKETEMKAAFEAADSDTNTGCTLRVYKNYTGSYTTLSGKFTLWIAEKANVGTLTVSGDITVTGSEKSNSFYGDFNVAAGGKLTFDENCGAMGTVSVCAGTFDCYYSLGITLNINDASSDVILHYGTFKKICYNGGGDRANAEILTLLAENRMFMTYSGETIDGSKTLLKDGLATVIVAPHEGHGYDSTTGKCKICGKRCGHTDVDSKTGVCPTCKYQLTAGISGVGTAKYFDNIDNAFSAALSAENNGCTLTLYKDCELSQNIVIGNATVTVDMNGHSILLAYRIKVNDGGVLYLKNSRENGSIDTEIEVNKGGTLINGTADDSSSAVSVFSVYADAAKCVEIYGGSCTGLTVNNGTSGIALYGGSYELIHTNDFTDSTPVSALLAKGYAFATLNSVTHLPEKIVDGSATTLNPGLENVTVVKHTHTYTEANTKCACGAVLYAKVTSADGTTDKYFDSIEEGLLYADKAENKGCVFTLVTSGELKDDVTLSNGKFTITAKNNNCVIGRSGGTIIIGGADVIAEGHMSINCIIYINSGSLTLPEGSSTRFDQIFILGGNVNISEGVNVDNNAGVDNLYLLNGATADNVTIGGGTYCRIALASFKLKDVLASGVRVISYDNSSDSTAEKTATALLYSDIAEESSLVPVDGRYYLVTKCEHKNEDGSYAFNEGGICKYCNSEFAASVSYTDGGSEKTELVGDIYDAFDKANEVGAATVTLYKDIENNITETIAVTGDVTLELNGKKLTTPGFEPYYAIEVKSGKLTVNGSGSIKRAVVRNGGDAEINGGTFSDFRIEDGGNAVINGGQFYSIKVSGEGRNVGQLLADGYAYKSLDGYWSTIAEREKQGIASVNVLEAPIKSASISWVGEEAPVIYRNGEKYLYVNITYELAVGSRGATYSDFVNGNNRIKDYNLYNKYMVHCYEIGKLAAKDGEVEYYIVLKCNGYEYKSNVLKLTLATCSHPEDSFSYENDGFVICGICDALIEAEVVDADGKSLGYADIESAIKLAQENEGSTVKLMSEGISESITVTGGRFTVDFNGKKVFYQFDVNGGDVTFTSSVKQDDVENLISEITVNGADAKVTIDGKIKLGSVTLTSGTLTVNSTDGYIKELSINGGKADIDGAEIDTLVFKGGDLAIRNVTVGSLDINKKATDATEHNIVIESGSFDTITCSDDSDYNIVKALASERRLRGTESGIIYEYSEIESLTEATDITVEKCDHKYANGNIAVDDDYVCYYCNSQIIATVSYTVDGSAKTDLFSDICDAFDKANEAGTATITLCRDIADSEIAHEINVTGNVTLALNGKTLGATDKANKINICGSTLTVNGNGKVWSTIEARPDSKLTITNGEYYDVYALSDSEVVILDGIIDCLSVYGTGKPEVSGGKFKYLFMYNGKAIESVLADGYAYKNADGTWLSIDEREKDSYLGGSKGALSVEEAPIKSASIAWAGGEAPVIYRNGDKYLNVNVTYTLADGSSGVTYSDYVNGNNRSKDSKLYTNIMAHCHEIGKHAAKDGEVEYYTVLKCEGYEYKSNVLKFTIATCSHPEDSFNYETNGWVICGICAALIEAEVVDADGKSLGYADIDSAIKLAQENEGSTVKLISERVPASITVTGGKFTVDFNGKEASYQFAVSGGDVTFTSSAVQDVSNQNLQSGITVNGTDAKVTIDGKIKLGRVRIISGTLTVNSTQGYIKELSIIGGNAVIDDAIIGALQTNGGDTVINCVEADSLSININGSGSLSIVTGTFGSTTCKTGLGMAIASGSVVLSSNMNGITVYTYEAIQTMTKTDRIFVDKCSHKDGKGSYVLDGNPCPYCNKEIVATVSYTAGGEETELFSDIYDAFAKANEIGTATVTLQKNITDDITDTIAVTGNVTVELNGKTLGSTFAFIAPVEVSDGGMFTVGGDGKMRMPIKAYANSKLIVGGGEFTSVMVYIDGDAEIGGGVIDALTIIGNAKAKISGGKFYNIEIANGSLESVLADGYAYKKDGGAWLSIAERAESVYSGVNNDNKPVNVEEAPIKSATITAEDESPIIYRNGDNSVDYTANVTYTGNETLYVTGCLIDGTVIKEKTDLSGNRYYLFSGEVNKAVAEDGEIQYYCIFTYDGYDYKSNVVTLTVATCQHPVESVKCDDNGNYVCGICNRTLPASVELSDGTLSYYGKWKDAISTAQESEGCTLKLLSYFELKDNETFDISKGRFTVDLNKNDSSTAFAFNVKGGDITFTAPQKASISFTGVQVSGENANVLIDSKATLNYLVVNSGKVSADGTYIGAITINGGDTVINDVNADYLSMKAGTTDGSGYNVSIVSGTFNIFTCENGSNYTLGKAIASGSRVIGLNAIVGSGFKYAEIQSMTKANYLNVIKCDHKDENDSYALDGNPCPYCNEEIVATVSYTTADGENTDLFSDIYDAFERANEVGTATVTLYKDIENSEFTRYITVTGNVTLALNGKKLGYSFVSRTVEVSDGGMLTVDGDGKMMVPIIVNENAKLTVNGGEIATVMIYKDGDAVIGGGFIEDLDVNGNVKLSGGKFYNIEIANGSLESILADGYAYKVDGGAWLSIAERAKEKYYSWNNEDKPVTVEEAPIKSATISTKINKLYRNSNANPTLKFVLALAVDPNQNDSDVRMRYGINSYECGDTVYSSLRPLLSDTKLLADKIIDKAGDSDAAEIYYVVTTGDGYEIKSNTVSIDLVDCDHSQVVDPTADKEIAGNITEPTYCEICESKFNAKITKGDDVKYYNDLDEAAKDAQKSENEGCTLYPLYNKNGYGGQLVITEGNFTLKYAVRTAFSRPIIINGKAKLTVTGRCAVTESENTDAFIVRGGDVTFDGLATGSNVTINGGNVTMAANNINRLTINGGNVSISSGGFAEIITNAEDKVIADYIDHGFWVQDRGTKEWIDIYSLNKATASSTNVLSVRVCPMQIIQPRNNVYYTNGYYPEGIPSLQINAEPWYSGEVDANVAYQWIAIDENGNETEIEGATDRKLSLENLTTGRYYCRLTYSNAATAGVSMKSDIVTATITECEHSGGEATCTNKAKCEICGAEYGEMKPHNYAHIKAPEYLKSAATCTAKAVYYTSCTECGLSSKGTADEATFEYGNALGHSFGEWSSTAPTCTEDGSRVRKCSRCDKIETEVIPATGHKYVDTVIKPTYTEKGYTLHKCSRCGSSYKDSYTNVLVLAKISGLKTVSRTDTTAKISWNKNPNADGYIIEQYNGSRWMLIARITSNSTVSFTAKTLVAGSTNKLRARAYKGKVYSAYAYLNINTVPSAITGFTLKSATSSTLNVAWNRNTSGDGYMLERYNGTKWVSVAKITNHATLNNTVKNLKAGTSYKFRIRSYKVFGSSTVYGSYTYLTAGTKPAAMSGIKVKSKTNLTASLQWNKNISADGYVLDKYDGSKWVTIKTLTSNTDTSFNVTGLKASTTFKFRLRAYKNYGTAKEYSEFTYFTVNTRPYTTTGMKCNSKTNLTANLQWNKNISADGYVLDKYDGSKWVTIKTFTSNANTSFNVTGLRASTTFNFRLRAYKNFDNGKVYSEFTYLNVNTRPYTTTGFKMKSATKNSVTLQWNKNISANGYCIEKWDGSKWVQVKRYTSNANVTYTATGLKADTAYKFRIRAYKTIGNVNEYSAYSAVVTARTKK